MLTFRGDQAAGLRDATRWQQLQQEQQPKIVSALRNKTEFSCEELQRLGVRIKISIDGSGNRVCHACDNVDLPVIDVGKQRFRLECVQTKIQTSNLTSRVSAFQGLSEAGYGKVEESSALVNVLHPPDGLIFELLEPVVSERLVSNRRVRDRVLGYAAESTGLESLIKGASPLPVPSSLLGQSSVLRFVESYVACMPHNTWPTATKSCSL